MKFFDEARIYIKSGNGGPGAVSFRREANVPKGGPDGGNGGRGGHIIFKASDSLNTLVDYKFKQHFKAQGGENGKGQNRHGKGGKDIVLIVPVGTQIFTEEGVLITDLDEKEKEVIIAKGGNGGRGNATFKSSVNQAPRRSESGEPGIEMTIQLKLKIISDVGIIGFPNAGKSTLITKISRAKPKVADYPFTTLRPHLGVVIYDHKDFVVADIPGLIEGASDGTGLGIKFLKHIERCKTLLHLIDVTSENVCKSYDIIRNELEQYSEELTNKSEIVALSKIDLVDEEEAKEKSAQLAKHIGKNVMLISSASMLNLDKLKQKLLAAISE